MTTGTIDPASKSHLPDFNSAAAVPGLSGKVDLRRDTWGIPHIRAASHLDAFAGLGFAHAQDRLWQMEALLRRGTGRYAQWVGKSALAGDVLARQLDTAGASRRDFALLNNDTKAMLEAYARGVNAFIGLGTWPAEYAILGARPAAWEPWHSIAVMRQIGFLMGSVWWKLWRAAALPIVGAAEISKLRFDDGGDDMLCIPPGAEGVRYLAALADLKPGLAALLAGQDQQEAEVAGGSNNWALHRSEPPPVGRCWLATRTACSKCRACMRRLISPATTSTSSASPFPACPASRISGITARWPGASPTPSSTFTISMSSASMRRSRTTSFKGGWKPVRHRAETISVRGGDAVTIDVVETHARAGHRRRSRSGHRPGGALDAVRRAGYVLRLHAADDASQDGRGIVRRRPRLGPDGSQPCCRRYGRPHRLPRARESAGSPARQRLAAGAGLDRRARMERRHPVREDAVLHRSGRAGHRHRQQPRDGKRRALFLHRLHAAASRAPHLAAPRRASEGDGGGHGVDPSRYHQRHRARIPRPDFAILPSMARPRRCATASSTGTATWMRTPPQPWPMSRCAPH